MFLASGIINLAGRIAGPRAAFQIEIWRRLRWRNLEKEFYLLDMLIDPARAALDVGANEGYYASRMAQLCRSVHCFEPIPWMAAALRRKLPAFVAVHEAAVSDQAGEAVLRIPYRRISPGPQCRTPPAWTAYG
jgi:hypothetical protein